MSNAKVPPKNPVILAEAPSQAGVIANEESSGGLTWKVKRSESPILKQPDVPITSTLGHITKSLEIV